MAQFIIVKHEAIKARLHYDLRFEMPNSKLWASFAVRKGVPTSPGTKVLAVRTHDHTREEALFLGTIPPGEYGAGKLSKWDSGTCDIHTFTPGKIAITFKGSKVKGLYYMISTGVINKKEFKKQSYILFKSAKTADKWTQKIYEELEKKYRLAEELYGMIVTDKNGKQRYYLQDVSNSEKCRRKYPNDYASYNACLKGKVAAIDSIGRKGLKWKRRI